MGDMLQFLGNWGHALCAGLFAGLTIWASRRFATQGVGKPLIAALSLTAIWALSISFGGVDRLESGVIESLRNCAWLVCLFIAPLHIDRSVRRSNRKAWPLHAILVLLLLGQSALDISAIAVRDAAQLSSIAHTAVVLRILWTLGALILIHRVFLERTKQVRVVLAPIAAVMAAMWGYDLLLYGAAYMRDEHMLRLLFAMRGGVMAALAPVLALSLRQRPAQAISPSRQLAWRGIGAAATLLATFVLLGALYFIDAISSPTLRAMTAGAIFTLVAAGLMVLPATRLHARLKLMVAKHLFRHRYDYREQWMAFSATIGGGSAASASIHERVVRAMANITESSGAVLLMPLGDGRFECRANWNWAAETPPSTFEAGLLDRMRTQDWIVDIAKAREHGMRLPEWIASSPEAWALVPTLHFGELTAILLLRQPPVNRALDWEDFDMLRAAGRQVAATIAEAEGQQALAEARRFEEFNRRFAFIMHDIKNLVSQIALVARNAERHADNPEFRADMVLTLKDAADRMNGLLARLSQKNASVGEDRQEFALGDAVRAVISAKGAGHPILIEGDAGISLVAHRGHVEQILGHLVQNAVEASGVAALVLVRMQREGEYARISVIDYGCGMDAAFIRNELFRPFSSTKASGFGVGAYEARQLAQAMDGQLAVESTPGKGSVFTLSLPVRGTVLRGPESAREKMA
jgi:putative PEP-CTERM system histidine kinase